MLILFLFVYILCMHQADLACHHVDAPSTYMKLHRLIRNCVIACVITLITDVITLILDTKLPSSIPQPVGKLVFLLRNAIWNEIICNNVKQTQTLKNLKTRIFTVLLPAGEQMLWSVSTTKLLQCCALFGHHLGSVYIHSRNKSLVHFVRAKLLTT